MGVLTGVLLRSLMPHLNGSSFDAILESTDDKARIKAALERPACLLWAGGNQRPVYMGKRRGMAVSKSLEEAIWENECFAENAEGRACRALQTRKIVRALSCRFPKEVCISMSQHMGPPCKPIVAKGDTVKVGTKIGDSDAFLSAPIHSSVSGTVSAIEEIVTSNGGRSQVVIIQTDGEQTVDENVKPPVISNHPEFVQAIKESGLVGLGGAGFPTHIKLNPKNL